MRILSFADTRFPIERANGVQTMATCHALASRGHDVRLVVRPDSTTPPRDPFAFYDVPPIATLTIDTVGDIANARARRARFLAVAAGLVAAGRADLVYTRDLGLAAFLLQLPLPRRAPLVYESHGISALVAAEMPALLGTSGTKAPASKMIRLDRRERRVWQRAQACVAITHALADALASRYGRRDRVFVVPDGARHVPRVDRAPRHAERPLVAGYAGHLYPWKGVDVFVQALALTPRLTGLIVGGHPRETDLARVRALVGDLGLGERVTITGLVAPGDVRRHLEGADVLVLPNTPSATTERFTSPLKLFEYLSLGRPIVASDVPSIREVLTDDVSALLVAAGDAGALAAALDRLADDPALRCRLGATAGALAPDYTWARRAERLEIAFAEACRA